MKIAMLFPGYGSQYVGMGKELYDEFRLMQEYFEEAANCLNINFVQLCFASSDIELGKIKNAYPALFLVSSSISSILKDMGIRPDVVAGYNTGEYAAVYAAECFSFPDGLYLLKKCANFYEQEFKGLDVGLLSIKGMPTEMVNDICMQSNNGDVYIAIYDAVDEHVISGQTKALDILRPIFLEHDGVTVEDVSIEVGLHSPLMDPVVVQFRDYLEKVDFKDLDIPLLSSIDAKFVHKGKDIKIRVTEQLHESIQWAKILKKLSGYDIILEAGPGTKLADMAKKAYPDKHIISINTLEDIEKLKKIIPATAEPVEKV